MDENRSVSLIAFGVNEDFLDISDAARCVQNQTFEMLFFRHVLEQAILSTTRWLEF